MRHIFSYLKKQLKNENGFTLIELIVVIAIIVVLTSLLVPNIIGYIKQTQRVAALADAKNIVTSAESALVLKASSKSLNTTKTMKYNGKNRKVGGLSNTSIYNTSHTNSPNDGTPEADKNLARAVMDFIYIDGMNEGNTWTGQPKPFGKDCDDYLAEVKADYALILLFDQNGEVPFMQIYHNGILVTYANGQYVANDRSDAKFINKGEAIKNAFKAAGKKESELDSVIKNTWFTSDW
jgi:prepilin-type N-terminal cleavage/methylation domain-containing protein